jgi:hypothetical protein
MVENAAAVDPSSTNVISHGCGRGALARDVPAVDVCHVSER